MRFFLIHFFLFFSLSMHAQVYQGLVLPDNRGRFGTTSPITQASGLALDLNDTSYWTHNDQGNPSTDVYKILPATGNQQITIQKTVEVLNVANLDWEDMAKDDAGNIYLCQIGKNCNANSDSLECPTRFIFKIHKLSLATLNHPDSTTITPETYYFKYPLTGYDVNNCDGDDTVFVNCEAAIWFDDALYFFSKDIWSKATNNCGGWINGYTYLFRLVLEDGSSMEDPLIAEYLDKTNTRILQSENVNKFKVTAADISPDQSIVTLLTYGRIWQFRNFPGDDFFGGTQVYSDFTGTGTDTITRGYEGVAFANNRRVTLCVDGENGRISSVDLDSVALWVRNTNDTGAGSLRNSLQAMSAGDTIRFKPSVINDTIAVNSALSIQRNTVISQAQGQEISLHTSASQLLTIPTGITLRLANMRLLCNSATFPCISNAGTLDLTNLYFDDGNPLQEILVNTGIVHFRGDSQLTD